MPELKEVVLWFLGILAVIAVLFLCVETDPSYYANVYNYSNSTGLWEDNGTFFKTVGDKGINVSEICLYNDSCITEFIGVENGTVNLTNYVPYIGATKNLDMGAYDLTATYLFGNGSQLTGLPETDLTDYAKLNDSTQNIIANSFRAGYEQDMTADEQTITQTGQNTVAISIIGDPDQLTLGSVNPVFSDGTQVGQVLVVKVVVFGDYDDRTLTIKDDLIKGNVRLDGDKTFNSDGRSYSPDVLIVMWNGNEWQEVYRNLGRNNDFSGIASGWGEANDFTGIASGWGKSNDFSGDFAGWGNFNEFSGNFAGWGRNHIFSGDYAGWGLQNILTYSQAVFGRFATDQGSISAWIATDDLFKIGIGASAGARADAFVVKKNGKAWFSDNVDITSDLIVGESLAIGSNSLTGLSSGDINASEVFVDALTYKSQEISCDAHSTKCKVYDFDTDKTITMNINKNWTIINITYNNQTYSKAGFWNIVKNTKYKLIALNLNNKLKFKQDEYNCQNQGYMWKDNNCYNVVKSSSTYGNSVYSYQENITYTETYSCTQLNDQLEEVIEDCTRSINNGTSTRYAFKDDCEWSEEQGYECTEKVLI